MTVAAVQVDAAVAAVFVLLTITFFVLAIGEFDTASGWHKLGGYLGHRHRVAAWYASMAGVTNASGRTVMPTFARPGRTEVAEKQGGTYPRSNLPVLGCSRGWSATVARRPRLVQPGPTTAVTAEELNVSVE